MTIAILLLLGAVTLVVVALRALRAAPEKGPTETRIIVEIQRGDDRPGLRLEAGGLRHFGPIAVAWAPPPALSKALGNPQARPGSLGGLVEPAPYRIAALVDFAGNDVLGGGQAALDAPLREALGTSVLLLERSDGGPPVLLHGADREAGGSIGGIALPARRFTELAGLIGDPAGLSVEVIRRRIQRAGWGTERAQRRRAG